MTVDADFETRSRIPIQHGTDRYSKPAEPLIYTFARDEGKAQLWDVIGGEPMPADLEDAARDPNEIFWYHNVPFDRTIWRRHIGIDMPIERYRCTMALAKAHGYPGSLEALGEILELPDDQKKRVEDGKLIQLFCVPYPDGSFADRYSHPEQWGRFCEYGLQDTETLRIVRKKLPTVNYRDLNLETWFLDQKINERGFGFDQELATAARALLAKAKILNDADVYLTTDGAVETPTQRQRLLDYFHSNGWMLPNLRASTITEWLEHDDLEPKLRGLLELRAEASRSSGAKYRRGLETVGDGNRIRFGIQYAGAGRTGRFSGKLFQAHNLPRPTTPVVKPDGKRGKVHVEASYIESVIVPGILSGAALNEPLVYGGPNEACGNALRQCIVPAAGNELVVADWSNIEGRILAWVAGEEWKLGAYRLQDSGEKLDSYKLLFARFFGADVASVTEQERQVGKVIDLSCGYLAGVGAFATMAKTYEMDLDALVPVVLPKATPEQLEKAEKAWKRAFLSGDDFELDWRTYMACDILKQWYREANESIYNVGQEVGRCCINAMKQPNTVFEVAKCKIWYSGSFLIIELPSGRRLLYMKPRLHGDEIVDPITMKKRRSEYISYLTPRGKSVMRERAWAGLFIENIVQAIANDILRCGLILSHQATWAVEQIRAYLESMNEETAISLHVHDEIVLDVPKGSYTKKQLIENLTTELLARFGWTRGLPLAAKAWIGPRFKKG